MSVNSGRVESGWRFVMVLGLGGVGGVFGWDVVGRGEDGRCGGWVVLVKEGHLSVEWGWGGRLERDGGGCSFGGGVY